MKSSLKKWSDRFAYGGTIADFFLLLAAQVPALAEWSVLFIRIAMVGFLFVFVPYVWLSRNAVMTGMKRHAKRPTDWIKYAITWGTER